MKTTTTQTSIREGANLLNDWRHIASHLREVSEKVDKFSMTLAVINEVMVLTYLCQNNDQRANLRRGADYLLSINK